MSGDVSISAKPPKRAAGAPFQAHYIAIIGRGAGHMTGTKSAYLEVRRVQKMQFYSSGLPTQVRCLS